MMDAWGSFFPIDIGRREERTNLGKSRVMVRGAELQIYKGIPPPANVNIYSYTLYL